MRDSHESLYEVFDALAEPASFGNHYFRKVVKLFPSGILFILRPHIRDRHLNLRKLTIGADACTLWYSLCVFFLTVTCPVISIHSLQD